MGDGELKHDFSDFRTDNMRDGGLKCEKYEKNINKLGDETYKLGDGGL